MLLFSNLHTVRASEDESPGFFASIARSFSYLSRSCSFRIDSGIGNEKKGQGSESSLGQAKSIFINSDSHHRKWLNLLDEFLIFPPTHFLKVWLFDQEYDPEKVFHYSFKQLYKIHGLFEEILKIPQEADSTINSYLYLLRYNDKIDPDAMVVLRDYSRFSSGEACRRYEYALKFLNDMESKLHISLWPYKDTMERLRSVFFQQYTKVLRRTEGHIFKEHQKAFQDLESEKEKTAQAIETIKDTIRKSLERKRQTSVFMGILESIIEKKQKILDIQCRLLKPSIETYSLSKHPTLSQDHPLSYLLRFIGEGECLKAERREWKQDKEFYQSLGVSYGYFAGYELNGYEDYLKTMSNNLTTQLDRFEQSYERQKVEELSIAKPL